MAHGDRSGTCDKCGASFNHRLIHNGFNESCYAYCGDCGATAVIGTGYEDRSAEGLPRHRAITVAAEPMLAACSCGGPFRAGAAPRCPECRVELSATAAARWIEAAAPGSAQGWKWQGNWTGLYAVVIDDRCVSDPWRAGLRR